MDLRLEVNNLSTLAARINLRKKLGKRKISESIHPFAVRNERISSWDASLETMGNPGNIKTSMDVKLLLGAVATVCHRYTGKDEIRILMESRTSAKSTTKQLDFLHIIFDFNNKFSLIDLVNLCDTKPVGRFSKSGHEILAELKSEYGFDIFVTQARNVQKLDEKPQETLFLDLNFDTKICIKAQLECFPSHVTNILQNGICSPNTPHQNLRILSVVQENQVLHHFNPAHQSLYTKFTKNFTLLDVFYKTVKENPTKLALVHDFGQVEIKLSYEQLYFRAISLALLIQSKLDEIETSQSQNQFIAAFFQQGVGLICSYIASLLLRKTLAVLHSSYTPSQVESCLASLGNPILLSTPQKVETIELAYTSVILIDEFDQEPLEDENLNFPDIFRQVELPGEKNKIPYCFFTSGSTGPPKGVLITEQCVLNKNYFGASEYFGLDASCRVACLATPGFMLSLNDVWTTFILGGTIYVPPDATKVDMELLKPWIYKHEITNFFTSTAFAEAILATSSPQDDLHLSKLKWIFFGGEKIQRVNLVKRSFNCCFSYGSTETYEISASILLAGNDYEEPPVGKPIPNVSVYILDSVGSLVPIGVKGDIYVSGVGLLEGYVGGSDPLVVNPFVPGSHMYKTGDVGYWSESGDLYVTGRKDSQVKIHGIRLELGEVETVIQKFPGVQQAVVVVRQIQNVKQLVAFCKLMKRVTCPPTTAQLYAYMETVLQRHAIPAQLYVIPEFPKTVTGKIDRKALSALEFSQPNDNSSEEEIMERGHLYSRIRQLWGNVIGIPETCIKLDSNFFFLGGNSMLACRMIRILTQEFPTTQLSQIYGFPVITAFVSSILDSGSGKTQIGFEKETQLNLTFDLSPGPRFTTCDFLDEKVLLTGVTGYFGPALLFQLLYTTSQTVTCIIRASSIDDAWKRLRVAFEPHCVDETFDEMIRGRVEVFVGDLSKPYFGLKESEYKKLCQRIDVIYHAAAEVNHLKNYAQLKDSTVAMTRNVIQFAVSGKLKKLHHMSSVAVFDGIEIPTGTQTYFAQETRLPSRIDSLHMSRGYAQSKWVSEQLVWSAIDAGVPAAIYRLGEIGSHTKLPVLNAEDALSGFLKACTDLRKIPDSEVSIPFISLDGAAEWVVQISKNLSQESIHGKRNFNGGRVFHIVEQQIKLEDFLMLDMKEEKIVKVNLSEWESEFFTTTEFKAKQNVGAWLFLDSIKESQNIGDGCKRAFVMKNILFKKGSNAKLIKFCN